MRSVWPARLRSLICSLIRSTYTGTKHPKVKAHASGAIAVAAAHWTFQF
jgi:hypothetical protein